MTTSAAEAFRARLEALMASTIQHGTYAGYQQHKIKGVPACQPCRKAAADYMRTYRKRGRCAPGLGWPLLSAEEAAS